MDVNELKEIIVVEKAMRKVVSSLWVALYKRRGMDEAIFRQGMRSLGFSKNHIDIVI